MSSALQQAITFILILAYGHFAYWLGTRQDRKATKSRGLTMADVYDAAERRLQKARRETCCASCGGPLDDGGAILLTYPPQHLCGKCSRSFAPDKDKER